MQYDSGSGMERCALTCREVEIMGLVASGYGNKAIAEELDIRLQTVKNHLSNVFAKLEVDDRKAAARALAQMNEAAAPAEVRVPARMASAF